MREDYTQRNVDPAQAGAPCPRGLVHLLFLGVVLTVLIGGAPAPDQDAAPPQQTLVFTPIGPVIDAKRPFYHQEWFWGIISTTVLGVVTVVWARKRKGRRR